MPWLPLAAVKGFLSKAWPFLLALAVAVLLVAVYRAGARAERSEWQAKAAAQAAAAERAARAADEARRRAAMHDAARIETDRKEVEDAIDAVPDQAPSARQRARACLELRRQAARAGAAPPAC